VEKRLVKLVKMGIEINVATIASTDTPPEARSGGEQRLYLLNAWEESKVYSSGERAALACTEAVTNM
jgi:hypothetical protein